MQNSPVSNSLCLEWTSEPWLTFLVSGFESSSMNGRSSLFGSGFTKPEFLLLSFSYSSSSLRSASHSDKCSFCACNSIDKHCINYDTPAKVRKSWKPQPCKSKQNYKLRWGQLWEWQKRRKGEIFTSSCRKLISVSMTVAMTMKSTL